MKGFSILVKGRVQGVFYRASTKEQADALHLKGFVRNELSGDVYIEAEGEEGAMQNFIKWCHQGPPRAQVTSVSIVEKKIEGFVSFEVRR